MMEEVILFMLSLGFLVTGINLWNKGAYLLKNGKTADAIIFKNEIDLASLKDQTYFPIVRFLTEEKEWITQKLSIGYYPAKKMGKEITVIYDPEDPTNVSINAAFELKILPGVFILIGLIVLVFGLLELFEVTKIIKD